MRREICLIMEIENFEKLLSRVTNGGVILIFDHDGWTYGSTEEYGDVNDDELYELISNDINETVKNIYIDDGNVIIIIEHNKTSGSSLKEINKKLEETIEILKKIKKEI